ncbi:unnamed protein product (macronuclear) [Paramecium tetraurelia]|uniref:Protein kinase domain-containing protein n=1 Tax=Paramecium tetraurelia TaxID=5888 RepID=A0DYV7_PARTE|nr:uncharacterized protein GSPATT00003192001 [Paramecium tetraurelia]CAK88224.1 unnamed protein product [Paramecium tetraurelia]|eukprot:XP_001455621.1 hypothetical protein (macronuclear) [Paramecium tetraurelia strain d4-2]
MQEVIKNYKIIKKIGQGATGIVYVVVDENNNYYALKLQSNISNSEKAMNNQIKEIKFQNVINTYEQFEYKKDFFNYFCVVMDFCNTGDLYQYLNQNHFKLTFEQKKFMLFQIAFGIWEIHQLNIIHRDIKPSNILVQIFNNDQFLFKICDLGLSKIQENLNTINIGTPYYMAPELIDPNQQKAEYDKSVDVWAFGALIFDFYSNQQLFFGLKISQIFDQIKSGLFLQQKLMVYVKDPLLLDIAKSCLSYFPKARPSIEQILIQLNEPWFQQKKKQFMEQNQKIFSPNQDKILAQIQDKNDEKQPQNQQYQTENSVQCQKKIEDQPKQIIQEQQKYDQNQNKISDQSQQIIQNRPSQLEQNQASQIKSNSYIRNKVRLRCLLFDQNLIEQLCTMIEKGCQQDQVVQLMDEVIIKQLQFKMNQIRKINQ